MFLHQSATSLTPPPGQFNTIGYQLDTSKLGTGSRAVCLWCVHAYFSDVMILWSYITVLPWLRALCMHLPQNIASVPACFKNLKIPAENFARRKKLCVCACLKIVLKMCSSSSWVVRVCKVWDGGWCLRSLLLITMKAHRLGPFEKVI